MKNYLDLLNKIMSEGKFKPDRTGTGTYSLFGAQIRFDLSAGFPLLTTKKIFTKGVIYELLWFLKGDTNVKYLQDNGVKIWDAWATAEQCAKFGREAGDLGPVYGHQWRNFGGGVTDLRTEEQKAAGTSASVLYHAGVDQIAWVIAEIKHNPSSRRLIVTAWNPAEQGQVALPPCHVLQQYYVNDGTLSCSMYMRSADFALGVPFNIASYAFLTHMIAQVCGLKVGELIISFGDVHVYKNHITGLKEQLKRQPGRLPRLVLNPAVFDIDKFKFEDFDIRDYDPQPPIKFDVAV